MKTIYPGKKSRSFGIFLLISGLVTVFVATGLPFLINGTVHLAQWIISGLIIIPLTIMFTWFWAYTYYIIDKGTLIVRWGSFKLKIPVKEIYMIRLNQKTIGGTWKYTNSWNSMEIKYKKQKSVFITPERQDDFIDHLKSLNNSIEVKQK
ncbi:MAG: PH domain-containing protein [Bacteroidales bacterium]|nr:PH domain-containing protein [Bacteroidales bacterium]